MEQHILKGILNCYSLELIYIDTTSHEAYPYYCLINEEISKLPIEVYNKIQRIVDENDIIYIKYRVLEHVLAHMFCTGVTNGHIIIAILFFKRLLEKHRKYNVVLIMLMVDAFFIATNDYVAEQGGWMCIKLRSTDSLTISRKCILIGCIASLFILACYKSI